MVCLRSRKFVLATLHLICLLQVLYSQEINKIETLLDKTDSQVQDIANQAISNLVNVCDSLKNCTPSTCLRQPCKPQGTHEIQHLSKCLPVNSNPGCSSSCSDLRISIQKSYIRLSPLPQEDAIQKSICVQKPLGQKLQSIYESITDSSKGWLYFGAAEGFAYVFPGRDYLDHQQCDEYDPRRRSWYINMFAVIKSLYILMDTSTFMSNRVVSTNIISCSNVTRKILTELLYTFTTGDEVAISKLSGGPIGTQVSVSLDNIETSYDQPEIKKLKDAINNVNVDNTPNDIKTAMSNALQFFGSKSNLKVLLILTSGQFASNLNMTEMSPVFMQLNQANVVVFMYRIGNDNSNDKALTQMQSSLNMTFDTVEDEGDPLWKLQSYFNYVAWLRFVSVQKRPIWADVYKDGGGLGDVTTCTYPAFDGNQRLIGVAGVDVLLNVLMKEVGEKDVQEAVSKRSAPPTSLQASYLNFVPPKQVDGTVSCPSTPLNPICEGKNLVTPLSEFICCGQNCSLGKKSNLKPAILGVSIGLLLAAGSIGLVLIIYKRRTCKRKAQFNPQRDVRIDPLDATSSRGTTPSLMIERTHQLKIPDVVEQ